MPTQLKLFSTAAAENFLKLENEVNGWLAEKGERILPVNSQTTICVIASDDSGSLS